MIKESEYKKRRDALTKKLSNNSLTVVFSAENKTRSNDTNYPYRQNSNFYYLTGFKEDNSALVIAKSKKETKTILFVQHKDEVYELWNGKRLGKLEARKRFLVDAVIVSKDFKKSIKKLCKEKKYLYYDFQQKIPKAKKLLIDNFKTHRDISPLIGEMRLVKSKSEISLIKKAIEITKIAHHEAMAFDKRNKNEYELLASIEHNFKKHGAYSDAYTSIVACGDSANTLHYISNDKPLVNGELILIDAGCEYEYYASDITRTIPVNTKFSEPQRELYNMILDTQLKIINMIKPGVFRSDLQKEAEILLTKGMIRLGILKGKYKKLIKKQEHKKYYPHGIGHWMGLDVHDEAPYLDANKKEIALKKGMVLTIEPGIYISKDDKNVLKKFRGIGIRIEDDILVTKTSYNNLSGGIAKTVKEIETRSQHKKMA
ncbi:aminopeptidase P N-terminal domain-containing protein [Sulfurimonas sp.]|uniref:aminopeptidase P N-terminal domain-containing protein n=1 Tax=Sulfurimonas sp. TaxID=2022749 RepID=UPI0035653646